MSSVRSIASAAVRLLNSSTRLSRERGSILILAAITGVIVIGSAGLAVDVGRMYAARADLAKDVDGASLAGVAELPNTANFTAKVDAYMAANGCVSPCNYNISADTVNSNLTVNARVPVRLYFLSLFGYNSASVYAHAKAGSGSGQPLDAALVIDDTASMNGQPLTDAKAAAQSFVSTVLGTGTGTGNVLIGTTAFRGCYNGPDTNSGCVPANYRLGLTPDSAALTTNINNMTTAGGSGTNVCTGLWQGYNILFNTNGMGGTAHHTNPNTMRFMVLLSDGGANYNGPVANHSTSGTQDSPPSWTSAQAPGNTASPTAAGSCRVSGAANQSANDTNTGCGNTESQLGRDLDLDAHNMASTLKNTNNNVEIYVVAFGVCQWDTSGANKLCDTTKIGGSTGYLHNVTDQNVLKCIASSTAGTNDHAYYVSNSSQLNGVFQQIAGRIVNRLIE